MRVLKELKDYIVLNWEVSCSGVKWKHLRHFSGRFTNNQQVYQPVFMRGT